MGVVYEAEDDLLKKTVAIKTIKKGVFKGEHVIRFQREANALAALNHPSLVPIYIFGITDDNEPYLVMQYESGKPLSEVIEARGRLPAFKSINIFVQLCDAIQHAHEHGVLHRDLKPGNVIVRNPESEHPQVVVIDFGIAMMESSNAIDALTKTGLILGTPAYMSPEQVFGKEPDERSDIYSIGCIMYESLTGRQPFSADSALELLSLKTTTTAPPLNSMLHDVTFTSGLEAIVAKCLATSPNDRYQSVADLKMDLIGLKTGNFQLTESLFEDAREDAAAPTKKKLSAKNAALAVLAVTVLVGASLTFMKLENKNPPAPDAVTSPKLSDDLSVVTASAGKLDDGCLFFTGMPMDRETIDDRTANVDLNNYRNKVNRVEINDTNITGTCFKGFGELPIKAILSSDSRISDDGLKAISELHGLKVLNLANETNFSARGLAYLKNTPKLSNLIVLNCNIGRDEAEAICTLKQIDQVSVEGNIDFGNEELAMVVKALPHLRYLSITATGVTNDGIKHVLKLKNLRRLRAKHLDLTSKGLEILSRLPHVERLDVKENPKLTSTDLKVIEKMKSLEELEIDSPNVSHEAKGALKRRMKGLKINDQIDLKRQVAD